MAVDSRAWRVIAARLRAGRRAGWRACGHRGPSADETPISCASTQKGFFMFWPHRCVALRCVALRCVALRCVAEKGRVPGDSVQRQVLRELEPQPRQTLSCLLPPPPGHEGLASFTPAAREARAADACTYMCVGGQDLQPSQELRQTRCETGIVSPPQLFGVAGGV